MGEKKQHYDDAMVMWKCRLNPVGSRQRQLPVPPQQQQFSQSTNNLPDLYSKETTPTTTDGGGAKNLGQSVNLRSHSDIRYHLNVFESSYYLDKQRTDEYRKALDEQIKERNRRKLLEKQMSNGTELAPLLLTRKSPSLPKLVNLNSTDVTKNLNFSPRLDASTVFSPQKYHKELSFQHQLRCSSEDDQRKRDKEETQQHFTNWSSFWGRAPARISGNYKKENLFKLLHYNNNVNRK